MIGEKARIKNVFVDGGYRGHKHQGPESVSIDQLRRGAIPKWMWRLMKRRAAIEPTIAHMKSEHRLERNRLKGTCGDAINAILIRACPQFQNNLVQSALPLKKRGHDTRISLPCPKSAGYD
jgi:IS5 family transposase